ncbi:MAG: tetratricopeptide repeat protein [Nocardioidaceae bacterium]
MVRNLASPQGQRADETEPETAELEARLRRYPAARYPAQHASTAFHLATVHLRCGRLVDAVPLLSAAYDIFGRLGMRLEQTKTLTMHGVALREGGRGDLARQTFQRAAREFNQLEQPVEEAAASYDLGLVLHEQGDDTGALQAMTRAYDLFLEAGHFAQAGKAAREQGIYRLGAGDVRAALPLLEEAAALAERSGDLPGLGAAANALGLAQLAAEDAGAAVQAFVRAVGAFPRSLRGPEHAMTKANLAVALERVGNLAQARLAARQALAVSSAEPPVRAQAQQLLDRFSEPSQVDLMAVLDEEPADRWPAIIREEVLRWCDARPLERSAAVRGFVDGVLSRAATSYDLAESLLAVVLELPPGPYADMVTAVVHVTGGLRQEDSERVHAVIGSAMARFAIPQWQRLAASLNEAAIGMGQPASWR